ncbi:MAG: hypothetical protein ABI859_03445 [Pseudomonadota bacterium]
MNSQHARIRRTHTSLIRPETRTLAMPAKALKTVADSTPDTTSRPHREPLGPLWMINIAMAVMFGGMAVVMMFD